MKGILSFMGQVGFYRKFIKDFNKISNPVCKLLENGLNFLFDEVYPKALELLKEKLISTSIIVFFCWTLPFEVMCNASGLELDHLCLR